MVFLRWSISPRCMAYAFTVTRSVPIRSMVVAPSLALHMAAQSDTEESVVSSLRQSLLHKSLGKLHIDSSKMAEANSQNMLDPTTGYDVSFGRPAIRCYRSFLFPKNIDPTGLDQRHLAVAADRCARQIDHLQKRHLAQQLQWIRNTDSKEKMSIDQQEEQQQATKRFPIIVVLDNIRSAFNVGSIFRTAEACGVQQVITTGITAHPSGSGSEKLAKSALGADRLVSTRHFDTTRNALNWLEEEYEDWAIIGMETTENSVDYTQVNYDRDTGCILLFGNEVTGIDPQVLMETTTNSNSNMIICQIPMFGAKNSLNVAACAPVVLYEIIRQWRIPQDDDKVNDQ
ncbi:TrmH family tRNA/rRNA methyltransferase [Seminavis robusta]|uniref:TrmH family tRNA/rRNA methyltransferase n=1 Tax=Seminavis robusta TaxID=568900 RepID=A0A9N8DCB5_9STRA|nr:TrmH family tRNA/rRNA methyltransferase [Seminavis robusta]|eukprot:Sro75_g041060.1 TrmH family tRNA/rRNA methyltransferase (343) ;mRNA; r:31753-33032